MSIEDDLKRLAEKYPECVQYQKAYQYARNKAEDLRVEEKVLSALLADIERL